MRLFPHKEFTIETKLSPNEVKKKIGELADRKKTGFFRRSLMWVRLPENRDYACRISNNNFKLYVDTGGIILFTKWGSIGSIFDILGNISVSSDKTTVNLAFKINTSTKIFTYLILITLFSSPLFIIFNPQAVEMILIFSLVQFSIFFPLLAYFKYTISKDFIKTNTFLTQLFEAE